MAHFADTLSQLRAGRSLLPPNPETTTNVHLQTPPQSPSPSNSEATTNFQLQAPPPPSNPEGTTNFQLQAPPPPSNPETTTNFQLQAPPPSNPEGNTNFQLQAPPPPSNPETTTNFQLQAPPPPSNPETTTNFQLQPSPHCPPPPSNPKVTTTLQLQLPPHSPSPSNLEATANSQLRALYDPLLPSSPQASANFQSPYSTLPPSTPRSDLSPFEMPPIRDRSIGRDVYIFDPSDPSTPIGGLILTSGITNTTLYTMVDILVIFRCEYVLKKDDQILPKDDSPLLVGNYFIHSYDKFDVNNENPMVRTATTSRTGPRTQGFRDAVRLRDKRCVVTGRVVQGARANVWTGFEAAHIFPLAYEQTWNDNNFSRWISNCPANGAINSVQNGILLRSSVHQAFDAYMFAINPDDNYKIVHFGFDSEDIAGTYLDRKLFDSSDRPPDELFKWHFRQAVLINMRGAGEPIFESDYPPGSDMMGSILAGPLPARRMEFELFSRLATQFDLTQQT